MTLTNPLGGLSQERIAAIARDYQTAALTVRDIIARHHIGKERLIAIVRVLKIEERARRRGGRPTVGGGNMARVFLGAAKAGAPAHGDDAVERAKRILRQRGCIVFDATVTDGSRGAGLIRVDGRRLTRAELLEAAAMACKRQ